MVREPTRIPPTYIAYPVPEIMDAEPETGLINDMLDTDGFSRQYSIAGYMEHEPDVAYLTLGMKCAKEYLNFESQNACKSQQNAEKCEAEQNEQQYDETKTKTETKPRGQS